MRIASLNVGMPKTVVYRGKEVSTAIYKYPVTTQLALRGVNFAGDGQADRTVHGGVDKAVYAYPLEHYAYWSKELPHHALTPGHFGENLTTEGLVEDAVCVGDEFRVGTARLIVTQPRQPCFKLGIRFDDPLMVRRFRMAGRPGIYFGVVQEGEVSAGDTIERTAQGSPRLSVADLAELVYDPHADPADLRRALEIPALADVLRRDFEERLSEG